MAWALTSASSYAVIKMIGMLYPSCFSLACNSRPDIFGMRMSTIKQAALERKSDSRNAFADRKHCASNPPDSIRSRRESCIDSLSSMMAINSVVWPSGVAANAISFDQSRLRSPVYLKGKTGFSNSTIFSRDAEHVGPVLGHRSRDPQSPHLGQQCGSFKSQFEGGTAGSAHHPASLLKR